MLSPVAKALCGATSVGTIGGFTLHLPVSTGPKARAGEDRWMSGVSRHAFIFSRTVGPVFRCNGTSSSRRPRINLSLVVCKHRAYLIMFSPLLAGNDDFGGSIMSCSLHAICKDIHAMVLCEEQYSSDCSHSRNSNSSRYRVSLPKPQTLNPK